MKILKSPFRLSFAIFILLCKVAFGQNFIENSFPIKTTTHATSIPGGWVLPMNSGDCSMNWILKYDAATGRTTKFFEADSLSIESFMIDDIIRLPSGSFICGGYSDLDNDAGTLIYPYVYKMNPSGKILWQVPISIKPSDPETPVNPIRLVSAPNGYIYILTRYCFLVKIDSLSNIIFIKHESGINDIAWTSKGLTAAYNNGLTLLDTNGNVIKVYYRVSGSKITGLENGTDGKFFAMNANDIYSLDSTFRITDSVQFTGYGTGVMTPPIITYADDSGYYFAHSNSIKAFDNKNNLKWTNYLPSDCNVSGLVSNGNQLAVTGTSEVSGFIKTYDQNGNTAPLTRDVEIIKLTPIKVSMHTVGLNFNEVSTQMNVIIQNKGSETIDSFYLVSEGPLASPNYSCSDEYIQSFHHLNLAPGDSTTLNIEFKRTWDAPTGYPYNLNVKMYATAPNGKLNMLETNAASNYSTTVSGINENQHLLSNINVYPNPATNFLHIDNNTGSNSTISLSDITGKQIMILTNQKDQSDMDVSGLPTGIYFVKVWNENGVKIEKVVKD